MKFGRIVVLPITLILLLGCKSASVAQSEDTAIKVERSIDIPIITDSDYTPFSSAIYINGKLVSGKAAVIQYDNQYYISVDALCDCTTPSFIVYSNGTYSIRRLSNIQIDSIQLFNSKFVALNSLEGFLHYNKDLLQGGGNLQIDTMLNNSVNINGITYYYTPQIADIDPRKEEPDSTSSDGRGIWVADTWIGIEDDWNRVFIYEESNTSIQ